MPSMTASPALARWFELDRRCACALNRAAACRAFYLACRVSSRLADGVLWYTLIVALPFALGRAGWQCALHMAAAGAVSLLVYLVMKRRIGRARPYEVCPEIRLCGRVLDRFSFPSGHTLHAAGFSLVLAYHFPPWTLVLLPFTLLVGISRVVLGLHYPSDVLAGAVVGAVTGLIAIYAI